MGIVACFTFQFTHPGRGATRVKRKKLNDYKFQFTHPGRGATRERTTPSARDNVSIHAPREGCDSAAQYGCFRSYVSIHAPREGCDYAKSAYCLSGRKVSIHAPREGCDKTFRGAKQPYREFQFTHPGRGATPMLLLWSVCVSSFNSRTPGGVRQERGQAFHQGYRVSIHAPREGCDNTLVVRLLRIVVSIHAPREGCDGLHP